MERVNSKPKLSRSGEGWLFNYVCILMHSFQGMTPKYVWDELPMVEGLNYCDWAINNDPVAKIFGSERVGRSPIGIEIDRLVEQAVKADPRWKIGNA